MKQVKEMWNLVFNWLGNGKKTIMGIGFLIVGIIANVIANPNGGLAQFPFVLMMIGALCLVNALFSKLSGCNINLLLFILVFVVIIELGIYLMTDLDTTLTDMASVWGPCFLFMWALQYVVLQLADLQPLVKRVVIAFFATLVGALAVVAVFFLPIFLSV